MITGLLLTAVFGAINALMTLIPSWNLPSDQANDVVQAERLHGYLNAANTIFPITALILVILSALSLRLIMSSWGLIVFIYHQFWGSE